MIADPERTLYEAVGARRPVPLWLLRPRVVVAGMRALVARERVGRAPGDDTLQLGADVVVDRNGRIAYLHLASDAADRTRPKDLVAVVRGLDDPKDVIARESRATSDGRNDERLHQE